MLWFPPTFERDPSKFPLYDYHARTRRAISCCLLRAQSKYSGRNPLDLRLPLAFYKLIFFLAGRNNRKNKSETKNDMPNSTGTPVVNSRPLGSLPSTPVLPPPPRLDPSEKKRGPGRPPGSTKQNIEQQRLLQQQQLQSNADIVKVNNKEPVTKKAKLDFEPGPPSLTSAVAPSSQNSVAPKQPGLPLPPTKTNTESEVKSKYNIDVVHNNPLKWNVNQVCDFVKNLPGCSDYVEDFQLQEIDGQALMLLKADHLMSAMAIKLGPALKICNAIEAMREELKQNWRRAHRKRVLFKLGSKLVGEVDVIEEKNNNEEAKNSGAENSADSSGNDSMLSKASVYDEMMFSDDDDAWRVCGQWATTAKANYCTCKNLVFAHHLWSNPIEF